MEALSKLQFGWFIEADLCHIFSLQNSNRFLLEDY